VDWLCLARIAGYICIAEMPEVVGSSATLPAPPISGQSQPRAPAETTIDRDEPILSDVPNNLPNLALET
jgi:hypothetical protein